MRLDVSQHLGLRQEMKLAPRIIQAMEILQLPMMALLERIEQEMEANPVLDLHPEGVDDEAPPAETDNGEERGERDMVVDDDNGNAEDFKRLEEMTEEYGPEFASDDAPYRARPVAAGERDRKMDAMANTPAHGESLNEYLVGQWAFVEADAATKAAGEIIINQVDDDGYLRTPVEELPAQSRDPIPVEIFRQALLLVQGLEPPGVAARNLQECLLLQLTAEQAAGRDMALEIEIVQRFLRDIEMNRLPLIAKRTGRTVEEIKAAIGNLSHLNPRPGRLVGGRDVPVILPEIAVSLDDDGEVVIAMSDGNTPQLRISRAYRHMARDKQTDRNTKQFLQKNIRSAQWLVSAIQQRRNTVRRVAEEVFAVQRDFLEHGREALRPLPMADVAEKVGVHVATVSRAVAGKYVDTPRGIYPLRMFFSGGRARSDDGEDMAWDAIKAKLKEVVDNEDKAKPLNDDELAAALQAAGIKIARRTVAKYRNLMDIPPARKRREF